MFEPILAGFVVRIEGVVAVEGTLKHLLDDTPARRTATVK